MPPKLFDLDTLDPMDMAQLRTVWGALLNETPPPLRAPELLRRELAWRLEVRGHGEMDAKLRRQLDRLGKQPARQKKAIATAPPIGSTLIREWDGISYKVVVLKKGYLFEGEAYRSLTQIAQRITGVHWSGPRFFGLKEARHG